MKNLYLAVVETAYTTYAIGETEEKAKKAALTSALKWLKLRGVTESKTLQDVEDNLGCNVFEIPLNQARQEY